MTAHGLIDVGQVPKGEYLIQTAAGSTLGKMITSLAKHKGINIIDVVRRSAQKEELLSMGCDTTPPPPPCSVSGQTDRKSMHAKLLCKLVLLN